MGKDSDMSSSGTDRPGNIDRLGSTGHGGDADRSTLHSSDCAMFSEPAYPAGPCDCKAGKQSVFKSKNTVCSDAEHGSFGRAVFDPHTSKPSVHHCLPGTAISGSNIYISPDAAICFVPPGEAEKATYRDCGCLVKTHAVGMCRQSMVEQLKADMAKAHSMVLGMVLDDAVSVEALKENERLRDGLAVQKEIIAYFSEANKGLIEDLAEAHRVIAAMEIKVAGLDNIIFGREIQVEALETVNATLYNVRDVQQVTIDRLLKEVVEGKALVQKHIDAAGKDTESNTGRKGVPTTLSQHQKIGMPTGQG